MINKQVWIAFGIGFSIVVAVVGTAVYIQDSEQDIDTIMNDPSVEDKTWAALKLLLSTAKFMRFLGLA